MSAARHDHVLHAIEDVEVSVRILVSDVSRPEQSAPERTSGLVRILPVAACDILAPRDQFTGLAGLDFPSRLVNDAHIDPRACSSAGLESLLGVLMVPQAGEITGFAQAIDLNEFAVSHRLPG